MIKRRFYKIDHADRGDASDSSSSSDFEVEAEATEESEEHVIPEVNEDDESGSTSSGYKSEDSSANDVDVNSSGQLFSEDDAETSNERKMPVIELFSEHKSEVSEGKSSTMGEKECLPADMPSYILKCKSVFKCRICPRIICLTEDTLRTHLQSKRHARSEKLLSEGRLKAMLNSDGEIENQEASEMQTKIMDNPKKNDKGRKQHKKRLRKKKRDYTNTRKTLSTEGPAKRRRKNEN